MSKKKCQSSAIDVEGLMSDIDTKTDLQKETANLEQLLKDTKAVVEKQQKIYDIASGQDTDFKKILQNAIAETPVTVNTVFDISAYLESNEAIMGVVSQKWGEWIDSNGKALFAKLFDTKADKGTAITFGSDTVYKVPENELFAAPEQSSGATEQHKRFPRLRILWKHICDDIVSSWWKFFAYNVALSSLVLAAAAWYKQWQLEDVVKEYYIIKPALKEDRRYAPLIHALDSLILKDGIDETCERMYGKRNSN